jgi:hypothetical protein
MRCHQITCIADEKSNNEQQRSGKSHACAEAMAFSMSNGFRHETEECIGCSALAVIVEPSTSPTARLAGDVREFK